MSLTAVDYYMRICKNEAKLGTCYLVMRRQEYNNLTISPEMTLFEEEPFESIYLKEVLCHRCHFSLGIHFETANCDGTAWLLSRIALNMEEIAIISAERNLVESLRYELQKLTPFKSQHFERIKEGLVA
jgi:hypothetical protein